MIRAPPCKWGTKRIPAAGAGGQFTKLVVGRADQAWQCTTKTGFRTRTAVDAGEIDKTSHRVDQVRQKVQKPRRRWSISCISFRTFSPNKEQPKHKLVDGYHIISSRTDVFLLKNAGLGTPKHVYTTAVITQPCETPCLRFKRPPSGWRLMPARRSLRPRRNCGCLNSHESDGGAAPGVPPAGED